MLRCLSFRTILCALYIYVISTCDFGVDSPRKSRGLSPWKPVPICPVGPCVLHPEMFGLILTCSKTLVYLKKIKKNFNYCMSRNIPPGVIFVKHQVACRNNSVYVFVNCFQIFKKKPQLQCTKETFEKNVLVSLPLVLYDYGP